MLDFTGWSLWINVSIFLASAAAVWMTGKHLVRAVDRLARRTGMGQGFAGMLLLGGIVSLTEISTVSTAAFSGSPSLALNNLLGSESINVFLLAVLDPLTGRGALTSFVAKPEMLLQGTMVIVLLAIAAAAMVMGDVSILGVGAWSTALFALCLAAMWLSSNYERRRVWVAPAQNQDARRRAEADEPDDEVGGEATRTLVLRLLLPAATVFAAGFLLSMSGEAIARQTGLGTSLVGFLFVGISTSLPELSSMAAAIRLKRYEMAVGDILGSNVYNLLLILLTDLVYLGDDPVLSHAGPFELVASLLGIVMTGILLIGLLERRDRTILKMGYDSLALIAVFCGGVVILYGLS